MRLWTYHTADFSLADGRVEHARSRYYCSCPGVREAYHELWKRLPTEPRGQLVWCYASPERSECEVGQKVEWCLDVPEGGILRLADGMVWERIIGNCDPAPGALIAWRHEAIRLYGGNRAAIDRYVNERVQQYRDRRPDSGSWWDHLFLDPARAVNVAHLTALLQHPIRPEWIVPPTIRPSLGSADR